MNAPLSPGGESIASQSPNKNASARRSRPDELCAAAVAASSSAIGRISNRRTLWRDTKAYTIPSVVRAPRRRNFDEILARRQTGKRKIDLVLDGVGA